MKANNLVFLYSKRPTKILTFFATTLQNNILSDLEKVTSDIIDKNSLEYNDLKNRIINVGEFENIKNYKKT